MDSFALRFEQPSQFGWHPVVRHEQSIIVTQTDQVAVEEPVARGRKRQTVLDDVRTSVGDRPDVRGFHLRPASAVDDFKPGHGTRLIVRRNDRRAECGIPERTIDEHLLDSTILGFRCDVVPVPRLGIVAQPVCVLETQIDGKTGLRNGLELPI